MYPATLDLIRRVQNLVGDYSPFFQAAKAWYSDIMLARKIVKLMLARSSVGARLSLTVNGRMLAGESVEVAAKARVVTWLLAKSVLQQGDNEIAVSVTETSRSSLYLRAVSASQDPGLPEHRLEMTRPSPPRSSHLELTGSQQAKFDGDFWGVRPGGHLTVGLRVASREPVTLSVEVIDESSSLLDVAQTVNDVWKKVLEVRQHLQDELKSVERTDPVRAARVRKDIEDLTAYVRLHASHLETAFTGRDETTMAEIISRFGNPDRLIQELQPPTPPELPPTSGRNTRPPELPKLKPVRSAKPPRVPAPPRPRPSQPAASGSTGLSCLAVLGGMGLLFCSVALAGWSILQPKPMVRIDSPVDGQTVAAGAPLQVWVSGETPDGVQTISLTARFDDGTPLPAPNPDRFTIEAGETNPGSKVFTLALPRVVGERKLTLVATMTDRLGKTHTDERVLQVGGTAQDLTFELNPTEPRPDQGVEVIVRGVNLTPGTSVSFSMVGTDGWVQSESKPVEADGAARFKIPPSGRSGVRDDLIAWIEGTAIRREVSYVFK